MNKKKLIGIISIIVVAVALIAGGIILALNNDTEQTGNRLDVDWYDPEGKTFVLTTADQLYEFAALSKFYDFKGQTIKLGADIVVNEGKAEEWAKNAPSRKWIPIDSFGGTFDGQGHTVSGLYAKGYDAPIAMFSHTMSNCTIKNFKLRNTYFEGRGFGGTASIASNGGGKFSKIYSDATLAVVGGYSGNVGGIASKFTLQSSIEECCFDGTINTTGRDAGGILDVCFGTRITIKHCLFSGELNSTWDFSGTRSAGIIGRVQNNGATLIIEDTLASGEVNVAGIYYTASVIGASYANTAVQSKNTYGSLGSYDTAIGRSGANANFTGTPQEIRHSDLIGTKAYEWTNLDFTGYWTLVEDDTPMLKAFADKKLSTEGLTKAFDTSWYSEGMTEFVITNRAQLYGLYYVASTENFQGKTVKLGADITVNEGNASDWKKEEPEYYWYTLPKFYGTFDGQGHTISGIYQKTSMQQCGFFKETTLDSQIKNFRLVNSYFNNTTKSSALMGSVAGRGNGLYENIYSNAIIESTGATVGGIIGQINAEGRNTISNCWFDGSLTMKGENARYSAGIVANVVMGNTTIEHCLNTATISTEFKNAGVFAAGIMAVGLNEKTIVTINDCLNVGKVVVGYEVCVGSIVGRLPQTMSKNVTITNTYATTESYEHTKDGFKGIGSASGSDYKGGVVDYPKAQLVGFGGYQRTTLDFDKFWAVDVKGTPILKTFATSVPSLAGVKKLYNLSWYKDSSKTYVINSAEDLYGLYIATAIDKMEGKTVKLGKDIVVNSGNAADWEKNAPAKIWNPLKKFAGTFDGQGHTISGLYVDTDHRYAGLFSQTTNTSTIKNFRLTNSYMNSTAKDWAAIGSIAGQMGGKMDTVYSNAIVKAKASQVGGLVARINQTGLAKYQVTNCWFDGKVDVKVDTAALSYVGGIAGGLIQGYCDINNCLNTGDISYTYNKLPEGKVRLGVLVGGIVGGVMNGTNYNTDKTLKSVSDLKLSDCVNGGNVHAQTAAGEAHPHADGVRPIMGYTTKGTVDIKRAYATIESGLATLQSGADAKVTGSVTSYESKFLQGANGYKYTELNFNKYWVARAGQVPALKSFASATASIAGVGRIDTSWYTSGKNKGTKADPFVISNKNQLFGFAVLVNSGNKFRDQYVKLANDITVNSNTNWGASTEEWIPIGTESNGFQGTFDGNNKTIKGIYVDTAQTYAGFFGRTTDVSTIKNFKLVDSCIKSSVTGVCAVGSVAGQMGGTMENIYSNADVSVAGIQAGGLVGRVNFSSVSKYKISNCWFDGTMTATTDKATQAYIGGIAGALVQGELAMSNCLNTGSVSYIYDDLNLGANQKVKALYVGGLIGAHMNNSSVANITGALNAGAVVAKDTAGVVSTTGVNAGVGYVRKGSLTYKDAFATTESGIVSTPGKDSGATVTGVLQAFPESLLKGVGGYRYTSLDFDKYWAAREAKVPALKSFVTSPLSVAGVDRVDKTWYTKSEHAGTTEDPYIIQTAGELYGFAMLVNEGTSFSGKVVTLGKDIVLNSSTDWNENSQQWIPIGTTANTFKGTFDGANKEISGLYLVTDSAYAGLFGVTGSGSVVKNLKVKDSLVKSTANGMAALGSIAGQMGGKLENVYSNARVEGASTQIGGLVGRINQSASASYTVSNCWFDGSVTVTCENATQAYIGGLAGVLVQGTLDMNNCLNTGAVSYIYDDLALTGTQKVKAVYVGGYIGSVMNAAGTANITGVVNAGAVVAKDTAGTANTTGVNAAVGYLNKGTLNYKTCYVTKESGITTATGKASGTTLTGVAQAISEAEFVGLGGYQNTILDFDKYWAAREGQIPALKSFVTGALSTAGVPRLDMSWYNTTDTEFTLTSVEQLYTLAKLVNEGTDSFAGKTITLERDKVYDISGSQWTPIGKGHFKDTSLAFKGTFDGNGSTIKGMTINNSEVRALGFIGFMTKGTVKNLRIVDGSITNTAVSEAVGGSTIYTAIGSVVGGGDGTIENVYSNITITSSGMRSAGIIGAVQAGSNKASTAATIKNCWYEGTMNLTNDTPTSGGIAGFLLFGTNVLENCLFSGKINYTVSANNKNANLGMLFGSANATASQTLTATNCVTKGTITVTKGSGVTTVNRVGSIAGNAGDTKGTNLFTTCAVTTDIKLVGNGTISGTAYVAAADLTTKLSDLGSDWKTPVIPSVFKTDGSIIIKEKVVADTTWYNAADTTFTLTNANQLLGLSKLVDEGTDTFEGKTINLKKDEYDISTVEWLPIGKGHFKDNSHAFKGILDGKGSTITGMTINNSTVRGLGFIGYMQKGTVKNLRIVDGSITNTALSESVGGSTIYTAVGSVVGGGDGTIENVYSNITITSSAMRSGGIIGAVQTGSNKASTAITIKNCWYEGTMNLTNDTPNSGGIVGYLLFGTNAMENCLFSGTINYTVSANNKNANLGMLFGVANATANQTLTAKNCVTKGTISITKGSSVTTVNRVGAISGNAGDTKGTNLFTTCAVTTDIKLVGNGTISGTEYVAAADLATKLTTLGSGWVSPVIPAVFNTDGTLK